jgi:hypothetical protein
MLVDPRAVRPGGVGATRGTPSGAPPGTGLRGCNGDPPETKRFPNVSGTLPGDASGHPECPKNVSRTFPGHFWRTRGARKRLPETFRKRLGNVLHVFASPGSLWKGPRYNSGGTPPPGGYRTGGYGGFKNRLRKLNAETNYWESSRYFGDSS